MESLYKVTTLNAFAVIHVSNRSLHQIDGSRYGEKGSVLELFESYSPDVSNELFLGSAGQPVKVMTSRFLASEREGIVPFSKIEE